MVPKQRTRKNWIFIGLAALFPALAVATHGPDESSSYSLAVPLQLELDQSKLIKIPLRVSIREEQPLITPADPEQGRGKVLVPGPEQEAEAEGGSETGNGVYIDRPEAPGEMLAGGETRNGIWDGSVIGSIQLSSDQQLSISLGMILGPDQKVGCANEVLGGPCESSGLMLEADVGLAGGKLMAGWGSVAGFQLFGDAPTEGFDINTFIPTSGYAIEGSVMRTWGQPVQLDPIEFGRLTQLSAHPGSTHVGVEFSWYHAFRYRLGIYRRVSKANPEVGDTWTLAIGVGDAGIGHAAAAALPWNED